MRIGYYAKICIVATTVVLCQCLSPSAKAESAVPTAAEINSLAALASTASVAVVVNEAKRLYPRFCENLPEATNEVNCQAFNRLIAVMLSTKPDPADDVVQWHRDARILYSAVKSIPTCYRLSEDGINLLCRELRWSEPYVATNGSNLTTITGFNNYKRYYRRAIVDKFSQSFSGYLNSMDESERNSVLSNFVNQSGVSSDELMQMMK